MEQVVSSFFGLPPPILELNSSLPCYTGCFFVFFFKYGKNSLQLTAVETLWEFTTDFANRCGQTSRDSVGTFLEAPRTATIPLLTRTTYFLHPRPLTSPPQKVFFLFWCFFFPSNHCRITSRPSQKGMSGRPPESRECQLRAVDHGCPPKCAQAMLFTGEEFQASGTQTPSIKPKQEHRTPH